MATRHRTTRKKTKRRARPRRRARRLVTRRKISASAWTVAFIRRLPLNLAVFVVSFLVLFAAPTLAGPFADIDMSARTTLVVSVLITLGVHHLSVTTKRSSGRRRRRRRREGPAPSA